MNNNAERKRSLLVRCWDVVHAEPIGPRQERLRIEVEYWRQKLYSAQDEGADEGERDVLRRLQDFLERNE